MGRNLQLCLATLIVLASFPQASNQAGVLKSETCFNQTTPCSIQNVTCSDDERIVILDEKHAFDNGTATCTDRCSSDCCQKGNFRCLHSVNGKFFSRTFSNCWNKTSCQYIPLQQPRVFTGAPQCSNGSSLFGVLEYTCTNESSVRDFTDPTPAVGNLLMASFSPSSRAYPTCVRPNSTLQCVLEGEQGGGVNSSIRVMLVMNHSTPGNCSKLHVTAGNYKSPDVLCSNFTEFAAVDNLNIKAKIFLELQLNNVKDEAWAVVQSSQRLKMTCGKTCNSSTTVPPSSSPATSPSSSTNTSSQSTSTSATQPATTVRTSSPPSSSSPATSPSVSTATPSSTSSRPTVTTVSTATRPSSSSPATSPSVSTTAPSSTSSAATTVSPSTPPSSSSPATSQSVSTAAPSSTSSAVTTVPTSTPPSSSSPATSPSVSTSAPSSTSSAVSQNSPTNVAAIAGGIVGSIVVIVIVVVIVVFVIRRQRGPKPEAAAHEPQQGHAVTNSAYDDWDLNSGDGEGGTANLSSPSALPPTSAPAPRPVTDVYAKVNKQSSRVASPPPPDSTGPQPGHLPACPASGEATDVYSRPKKGGKKNPDKGDNSVDVTSPEDSSSPPVIPPRHFRSSEANAPEGHLADYDHLGQKRRPTPQPGDVTYGHLGNKMAADDPEVSYDQLRSGRGGGGASGPAVLGSHVYGRLGTEGATEEGRKGPYDRLGGAGRRDVIKDVYHVASDVDTDPYSEHEPNIFEDD